MRLISATLPTRFGVLFRPRGGRSAEIAAIDGKRRSGDETRFRTDQIGNQTCNFAVFAETAPPILRWTSRPSALVVQHGDQRESADTCRTPKARPAK